MAPKKAKPLKSLKKAKTLKQVKPLVHIITEY